MIIIDINDSTTSTTIKCFSGKTYFGDCAYYFQNDILHRMYEPAKINYKINYKKYYFSGNELGSYYSLYNKYYNQKQFLKDVNKSWLL